MPQPPHHAATAALAGLCLVLGHGAAADTISVCPDGSCDHATIESAIAAAASGDIIDIAAGTYVPSATLDTQGKAITLRGALHPTTGARLTIVRANYQGRAMQCMSGEGEGTVFENLQVTTGYYAGGGSGLFCASTSPMVVNCEFSVNWGPLGGAVRCDSASPTFIDCLFHDNTGSQGAAIYCSASSPAILRCTFLDNIANGIGGAVSCHDASAPTLLACTFRGNRGTYGGGLYTASGSAPTVTACTFSENTAYGYPLSSGGGVCCGLESTATVLNTTLCGNAPDQVSGTWTDGGGNCLVGTCADADQDGTPDKCLDGTGVVIHVPADFQFIQDAIEVAPQGAVIEVAPGLHWENSALNPQGKPLTIRGVADSETGEPLSVLTGNELRQLLRCTNGEGADTRFENLLFLEGKAQQGGAVYCAYSSPAFVNCQFRHNLATLRGGAVYMQVGSNPTFTDCSFEGNIADFHGGALHCDRATGPVLSGCRITDSLVGSQGSAMYCHETSSPTLLWTTVCGNYPDAIYGEWIDGGNNEIVEDCEHTCPADLNGSGTVSGNDLALLLAAWGTPGADITGDATTSGADLAIVLGAWGPCPWQ